MGRCACRPPCADLGHVDLVHPIEQRCRVTCENTRESGAEARADHDRDVVRSRHRVELEQAPVPRRRRRPRTPPRRRPLHTGGRGRRASSADRRGEPPTMFASMPGVGSSGAAALGPGGAERSHHGVDLLGVGIADDDALDLVRGRELPRGARADRSHAHDRDVQRGFNAGRGRSTRANHRPAAARLHYPARGGSRRSRPRRPAPSMHDECSSPVGLAGIEPATSSLSGMRSNRLSYSPKCEEQR